MLRLTRAQLREIDRRSTEQYHIPGIVLMENASRAAADAATKMLADETSPKILVICGGGNNGGDGLAAARHLHNSAFDIQLAMLADPSHLKGDARINWEIALAMKLPWQPATPELIAVTNADLILDAIFGTGLENVPRDPFPAIVTAVNSSGIPVLAIDLPSGMECDSGQPLGACVRATQTITFVAEKIGFAAPSAADYLGKVTVGSIGCPSDLIADVAGKV